jgi:hypothetical protein
MMLTSDELVKMRAEAVLTLVDVCSIKRQVITDDGYGGKSKSESVVASAVVCRVGPSGRLPEERIFADRLENSMPYTVTLPALTDVEDGDVVALGTRRLRVMGVARRSLEVVRRCVCVEVR